MPSGKIDIGIKVLLIKDGDYIVAYSPELDFSSFGTDEKDALQAFGEGVKLFLEETWKMGTLEKLLLDLGWSLQKKPIANYRPPFRATDLVDTQSIRGTVEREISKCLSIPL